MRILDSISKKVFRSQLSISTFLLMVTITTNATAQAWKEADDFHWTLAFTYHPMKDDGNFQPIKERSAELHERAVALENAKLPTCIQDETTTQEMISSLVKKSKMLDETVTASGSDEQIMNQLEEIHTLFHTIEEKCR